MKDKDLVLISKGSFIFCRYTIALFIWLAFIFKIKELILVVFVILALSAVLGVNRAPMIVTYNTTLGRIFPSRKELLSKAAMRFAHVLGSVFAILCAAALYGPNEKLGWIFVFILGILKTISAFGFCPASKLYTCTISGGCCGISRALSPSSKNLSLKRK